MKKIVFPTLFSILFSISAFAQSHTNLDLGNDTQCDLVFHVSEWDPGTSCTQVQFHSITVPAGMTITLTSGSVSNVFIDASIHLASEPCEDVNVSAPELTCLLCPQGSFPSSLEYEVNCEGDCYGSVFEIEWAYFPSCPDGYLLVTQ